MNDEGQEFEELTTLARVACAAQEDEEAEERYWDIVWLLARRGDQETLDQVLPLTRGDAFERSFAASVLGRFSVLAHLDPEGNLIEILPERFASGKIIEVLLGMLETEQDEEVLAALVSSLGQHQEHDERIPPALCRFLDHPNADIRWYLAMGMGSYETPEAVDMLITLSCDEETRVRDWATFGLGSLNRLDSTEIRDALVARLDDEDAETRIEAIEGLALRHDPRVVPVVMREFNDGLMPEQNFLPSERLLEALVDMEGAPNYGGDRQSVRAAITFCESVLKENEGAFEG